MNFVLKKDNFFNITAIELTIIIKKSINYLKYS